MFAQLEYLMAKGAGRIEHRIAILHPTIAERNPRLVLGNVVTIQKDGALVWYRHGISPNKRLLFGQSRRIECRTTDPFVS